MRIENIGGIKVDRSKPFLILEAGVNHEGSLDTAFEMIDSAAEAGADVIKFQSYKAETLASRNSPAYWDRSKEPTNNQYELFKKHDSFGDDEYRKLAERCEQKDIIFCSTPFDSHFVDFLDSYMPLYKIASADITNLPFMRHIASKGKPILLSTGASNLDEVVKAVDELKKEGCSQIALMHCVLEYPTCAEHVNLNTIPYLQTVFPELTIGYSDHVVPEHSHLSLLAAWMLGADILEKHYTLDKTLEGNDHYHAFDPDDVKEFVSSQRCLKGMLGKNEKVVWPWEEDARKYARRSLVAVRDIAAGMVLTDEMLTAKRPGTGISPVFYEIVVGRTARADIKEDEILQWDKI